MKDVEQLKEEVRDLLVSQRLAVLATRTPQEPYTSLVAFAQTPDLSTILFATTRTTRKYVNLSANARVALLIDNRSNEAADFRNAMGNLSRGLTASASRGFHKDDTRRLANSLSKTLMTGTFPGNS